PARSAPTDGHERSRSARQGRGGRYWVRTSDLFRVREARYRCANRPRHAAQGCAVEVGTGFEPVYTALQAVAKPLGQPTGGCSRIIRNGAPDEMSGAPFPRSGRPDSNRRPSPWQGDALPAELRPHDGDPRIPSWAILGSNQ